MEHATDADLVNACRDDDQVAWCTLVSRYRRLVFGIAVRSGLDAESAADVFQRVFTLLVEHLDHIDHPDRVRAWLVTATRRESARLRRREQRVTTAGASFEDAAATLPDEALLPDEVLLELERRHLVRTALATLDDRCRHLLELLFSPADVPAYSDVAAALGTPEGSIGPTRARCLAKLRRVLDTAGFNR